MRTAQREGSPSTASAPGLRQCEVRNLKKVMFLGAAAALVVPGEPERSDA